MKTINLKNTFMKCTDINGKHLKYGDIIDIHQTVNGCSQFVFIDLRVYYYYEGKKQRPYEYDEAELLEIGKEEKTIEIIGNICNNDKAKTRYNDCPECKKGKIKTVSKIMEEGAQIKFYDCNQCGYRVDIAEMIKK